MSIYRLKPDFRMWDCWMFRDGADYHLFTLTQPYGKPAWDRVCHAVTRDWLHWEERPEILTQDTQNPDAWDADVTLTGSVFRTENGYGCIARVTSRDLVNWEYHPPLASPGRHLDMEVPQYFYWNGIHYLLYSTSGIYRHLQLPSRQRTTGTFYLMSDSKSAKGWAVSLDRERSRIELCRPINQGRTSLRLDPLDVIYGALPEQCTVEMWVRDSYVEIYVNSRPCVILNTAVVTADEHVSSGRFGLFVENGTARFRDLRLDDIALKMMMKAEG